MVRCTPSRSPSRYAMPPLLLAAVALLNTAQATAATVGAAQWAAASGGNDHLYEAVAAIGITWTQARAAAEAKGGYLATITSAAENAFIAGLVPDYGTAESPYWLGGFQPMGSLPTANWQWVTGEQWDYSNWAQNEPSFGGEHALVFAYFAPGDTWNNAPEGFIGYGGIGGYVIEYTPPAEVPLPASLPLFVAGLASLVAARRPKRADQSGTSAIR